MSDQLIGIAVGALAGGFGSWVAIRVEVALARRLAEDAKQSSETAHSRITEHIERHHVKA